jgi:hypothetical protein
VKKSKIPELQAGIDAAGGVLQRGGPGGAMSIAWNAPVKKAPNAPALQAAIDSAGGVLQKGGAGGAMSFIGAMGGECAGEEGA